MKHPESKTISLADPEQVMRFANVLKSFITQHKLSTNIAGNDYANVDAWKYAGISFGMTAIPTKPEPKHQRGEYITTLYSMRQFKTKDNRPYTKEVAIFNGFTSDTEVIERIRSKNNITKENTRPYFAYECDCIVVKIMDQGVKLSRGTGHCSNMELLKAEFDEYAIISMCETRSIGKAYRNLIGFVIKAAGFEPTPAEEMNTTNTVEGTYSESVPDLPIMTDMEFDNVSEKIINGDKKWTLEHIESAWTLGPDQKAAFEKLIEKHGK